MVITTNWMEEEGSNVPFIPSAFFFLCNLIFSFTYFCSTLWDLTPPTALLDPEIYINIKELFDDNGRRVGVGVTKAYF